MYVGITIIADNEISLKLRKSWSHRVTLTLLAFGSWILTINTIVADFSFIHNEKKTQLYIIPLIQHFYSFHWSTHVI